jgi:glycerol dehydrogenase-like iron-containing ADH family enzyme
MYVCHIQTTACITAAHLAAHGLNHLPAQLHGWREGLGVVAQDVAKVDVEQTPIGRKHQVVQVPDSSAVSSGKRSSHYTV